MSTVDRLSGHRGRPGCRGQPAAGQCGSRGRCRRWPARRVATGRPELAATGADPRTAPPLPPDGPHRLSPSARHGVLLPAGGLRQRRATPHWVGRPGRDLVCVRPHRQGLGQDAVRHLRKLLPPRGEVRGGGWRWRRAELGERPEGTQLDVSAGELAQEHGEELGFGVFE
uniref:(northern house mosquito) hypothetical protein n=1 Tax=Culex pipiens TaxID=7175 RepID=A0A8D8AAA3_CULPI